MLSPPLSYIVLRLRPIDLSHLYSRTCYYINVTDQVSHRETTSMAIILIFAFFDSEQEYKTLWNLHVLYTYMHAYIHSTYVCTDIHTCMHKYVHTYMPTYIHAYMHDCNTCMHTYIHIQGVPIRAQDLIF